jgi:hypothetical protein
VPSLPPSFLSEPLPHRWPYAPAAPPPTPIASLTPVVAWFVSAICVLVRLSRLVPSGMSGVTSVTSFLLMIGLSLFGPGTGSLRFMARLRVGS